MPSKNAPWQPVKYENGDVAALQVLARGEADAEQAHRAWEFILDVICDRNGMSYRPGPDGDRETAFAEGKRYVGNQIVKLAKMPLSKLKKD